MNIIDFFRLYSRASGHSFPVLLELKHPDKISWYFTSNAMDIYWNEIWFKAVPMSYKFPTSRDGVPQGGNLEIDIDIQYESLELLKWFDELDDRASINVLGLLNEQGDISPLSYIAQSHGTITWDGSKISWQLEADDRMNMQINPWVMDFDALTG
jgi:hypothetical protein